MRLLRTGFQIVSRIASIPARMFYPKGCTHNAAPVFIVGAPRTGSTILYQRLTRAFDVSYIDNLAARFYFDLPLGIWLSQVLHKGRPHNTATSVYGRTPKKDARAPHECGAFWYRWIDHGTDYVEADDITPVARAEITREISKAIDMYGRPMLFKNLNCGQRLSLIHVMFPDAKIIFLQRDPRFVVQSIMKARKTFGIPANEFWSVKPKNFAAIKNVTEVELCVAQVHGIEAQIKTDIARFFPDARTLQFEDIDDALISDLGEWMGAEARVNDGVPAIKTRRDFALDTQESQAIDAACRTLNFDILEAGL